MCGIWGAKKGAFKSQPEMLSKHPKSPAPTFSSRAHTCPATWDYTDETCLLRGPCSGQGRALQTQCPPVTRVTAWGPSGTTLHTGVEPGDGRTLRGS